jgi:hypothetical protein
MLLSAMRGLLFVCAICLLAQHGVASAQSLPTFAQLEAAGARFGKVSTVTQDVFDTSDPQEDKLLFRWANNLHIQTRPGVVARALLFKTGDPVQVRVIEETERLLRGNRYLYDVQIRVVAVNGGVNGGVVDVEVSTRDTWSLEAGASASRAGGANSSGLQIRDQNFLGTGMLVSLGRSKTVDRTGTEFQIASDRVLGTALSASYSHANNSDGRRDAVAITQPFYGLNSRWAGGFSASKDDRVDAVYSAGKVASQYRHQQDRAEAFLGWSPGLVNHPGSGWVQRYTVGVLLQADTRGAEPGLLAPPQLAQLPPGQSLQDKRVAPFVRCAVIEDRFERETNRNLIGRPEYFALGFASSVQLGWASRAWGSSHNTWLYSFAVSQGFEPVADHSLIVAASASGETSGTASSTGSSTASSGTVTRQHQLGLHAQYYAPHNKHWLFYASAAADTLTHRDPATTLHLGGDTGLRGYPLRYQNGSRRVLLTLEERYFSDLYVWRLFRVGGAAFFDAGRAWGDSAAPAPNTNNDWLANAGVGLRIVNSRAAFSSVLHIDIAWPINAPADIKKTQFLVKSKASF